ncbi:MAG: YqeG family HAD IIIA-type phosphatase [Firmicutes bacterium]|mgnify:CR=1 FL=1|nr:YqeG family HAD IIIA-type phosphatase [Candidatus Fermentithermobacillaceae bacterium]
MHQASARNGRTSLRGLLTPSLYVHTIYDLPLEFLIRNSITAVITDLDNTLVPWRDYRTMDNLCDWFKTLHEHGFKTLILSNAKPDSTIYELSADLDTRVIVGARKPLSRFFKDALGALESRPEETCVIGDQLFTDILGGNIIGCHTVLVNRVGANEFIGTRIVRVIEGMVLKHLGLTVESERPRQ